MRSPASRRLWFVSWNVAAIEKGRPNPEAAKTHFLESEAQRE
jgi:hypothetical protein